MGVPFTPFRCSPLDFINPFPPFFQTSVVCAGLLLAEMLLLFLWHGSQQAIQQRWQSYSIRTLCLLVLGGTLWSPGLAWWLWGQSSSFKGWCTIGNVPLPQFQAFQATQSIIPMTGNITMALLIASAAVMALLLSRKRGMSAGTFI